MNTQSYTDIIADQLYNDGFAKGKKSAQRELTALRNAAKNFLSMYESSFGEPEQCDEYSKLKKLLA